MTVIWSNVHARVRNLRTCTAPCCSSGAAALRCVLLPCDCLLPSASLCQASCFLLACVCTYARGARGGRALALGAWPRSSAAALGPPRGECGMTVGQHPPAPLTQAPFPLSTAIFPLPACWGDGEMADGRMAGAAMVCRLRLQLPSLAGWLVTEGRARGRAPSEKVT
eukprot:scaffold1316_cov130-Isochrysis_galbana.AAC.2